ncbi:hypothetical protein JB92DRAFT_2984659 [Gautieria morchelliformis]|nr:hypothetical protein JB92DRAFT_2984659 [Gautieria morchelliformis]
MPRTMVHPRLKRILSEPSSAVSSPPDTASDTGKPERESEDRDPEVESLSQPNRKGSDAEQEPLAVVADESPESKMEISDEDANGAPKLGEEDRVPVADVDATQKSGEAIRSRRNKRTSLSIMSPPTAEGGTPSTAAAPVVPRGKSPDPPPRPVMPTSRSTSQHSTKDFKDSSPMPPSTSASANRSPTPQPRPSLRIKLKLGAKASKVTSEAEAGEERMTRGRRSRARGTGKGKAKGKARPLTFTLPPRPRTDPSETSSRPSISRSQSSQHSSVESEDEAEDADAESENENNAHPDQNEPDDDAMDVGVDAPDLSGRQADDVESEDDGDIPNDDMDGGGGDDDEVLPGGGKGRLTARQAVLASMVGADHVELEASTSSRKKQLTSEEIALKREETARKRKNMSEKKLEDEKTETINRLLKKQSSRSKAKRSTLLNTSVVPTPQSPHSGDDGESDAVLGAVPGTTDQMGTIMPGPVWRWVSNSSGIRLGVPSEVVDIGDAARMDAASNALDEHMKPRPAAICNVPGCCGRRKYRLVRDFEQGACGIEHLRVLSSAA